MYPKMGDQNAYEASKSMHIYIIVTGEYIYITKIQITNVYLLEHTKPSTPSKATITNVYTLSIPPSCAYGSYIG